MAYIRYYSPYYDENIHNEILALLSSIKDRHGIDYEVKEVVNNKATYDEDFKPHAKEIKSRTGEGVARILRAHQGRGRIHCRGEITIVDKDHVGWIACYEDPLYNEWQSYDENRPTTMDSLKMILDRGESVIKDIMSRGKVSEHSKLTSEFISSKIIYGKFEREVPIGSAMIMVDKYRERKKAGRKSIDLVYKTSNEIWVLEVEPELNASGLDQALIYKELYIKEMAGQLDLSSQPLEVKSGIICRNAEKEVLEICEKFVDDIFVMGSIWEKHTFDWSK